MASKDDNNTELAIGVTILAFVGIFLFALLFVATFVLTLLAFYCWNEPRKIGKKIITPRQARGFVYGGVAGSIMLPIIVGVADVFFDLRLDWDKLAIYLMVGGYIAGAFLVDSIIEEEIEAEKEEIVVPMQRLSYQSRNNEPVQPPQPFRFASWEDEEDDQ